MAVSRIEFEERGLHQLKDVPGVRLFAYVDTARKSLVRAGAILAAVTVLGGELAVPCIRNPL